MAKLLEFPSTPGKTALIGGLRARIGTLERAGHHAMGTAGRAAGPATLPLGVAALDRALPGGGLVLGRLHEVAGPDAGSAAAMGFCAMLLARLSARGPVLWVARRPDIHAPGFAAFAPAATGARGSHHAFAFGRLIAVRARRREEILWAMEEGLRAPALSAVLGEVPSIGLTASRRLQLAAEAHGVTGLLLSPGRADALPPTAATTRWRVAAAPSRPASPWGGVGPARWRVELLRCRGGRPDTWILEWCDETRDLALVPPLRDRPADPAPAALAV